MKLLRAGDLAADVAAESEHRARHVAAAHRTWGIAIGLHVRLLAGGAAVAVGPGLAYDACGAERVSPGAVLRAPAREEGAVVDLVLAAAPCPGRELGWRAPAQPGREVPLARFTLAGGLLGDPDLSVRDAARPLSGGRIATGTATLDAEPDLFMTADVDTSAGGFAITPVYHVVPRGDDAGAPEEADHHRRTPLLGPFCALRDPSPAGFTLDVRFAAAGDPRGVIEALRRIPALTVAWLGAEPPELCDPDPRKEQR